MKVKTALKDVPVGTIFNVWGREYTKLDGDDYKSLVIQNAIETSMPFNENGSNNFASSDIRYWMEEVYVGNLVDNGANANNDILPITVDLKCTLGQHEYGTVDAKAGLLTLEQYGEYYEIIPPTKDFWWLATPLATHSRSSGTDRDRYALRVVNNGGWCEHSCSCRNGVRPALVIKSQLLVDLDKHGDETNINNDGWESYIKYLLLWVAEHANAKSKGYSPLSYDEWRYDNA